ncbi:hypothetical protein LY78DRAFT_653871 [Colletotrichum sublineola]|nr:hypothetical protein LY78DRAFT_653871 [Colletotrichum sublineola]
MSRLSTPTSHAPLIPLFLLFGIDLSLPQLICDQLTCQPALPCAAPVALGPGRDATNGRILRLVPSSLFRLGVFFFVFCF